MRAGERVSDALIHVGVAVALGAVPTTGTTAVAAVAPTEDASAGLIDLALAEVTENEFNLQIYGFADFTFSQTLLEDDNPWLLLTGEESAFYVGNLNTYLRATFGRWDSLIEVRFLYEPNGAISRSPPGRVDTSSPDHADLGRDLRWGGIEIERAWLEYEFRPWLAVRLGQWLTPYGIWIVDHGSPTIIAVRRPYTIGEALFPERQTGIQVRGSVGLGPHVLGYHVTLSNGRGPVDAYDDLDENKAVGGRLFYRTHAVGRLTVGVSAYYGRYTNDDFGIRLDANELLTGESIITEQYDELALAADLRWQPGEFTLQIESIYNARRYTDAGRPMVPLKPGRFMPDGEQYGTYVLLAYRTPWSDITPFVIAEHNRQAYNILALEHAFAFYGGLNWRPHPRITLKAQYNHVMYTGDSRFADHDIRAFDAQVAWAF